MTSSVLKWIMFTFTFTTLESGKFDETVFSLHSNDLFKNYVNMYDTWLYGYGSEGGRIV